MNRVLLTALKIDRALLLIKRELLQVHPAIHNGLVPAAELHHAFRSYGNEYVLGICTHYGGGLLVGDEDVRGPDSGPELVFPDY